jgi:hypothetical protein
MPGMTTRIASFSGFYKRIARLFGFIPDPDYFCPLKNIKPYENPERIQGICDARQCD